MVADKFWLVLFGTYPYAEKWRAALAVGVLLVMYVLSTRPSWWHRRLAVAWVLGLALFGALMWGGVGGLAHVPEDQWGG